MQRDRQSAARIARACTVRPARVAWLPAYVIGDELREGRLVRLLPEGDFGYAYSLGHFAGAAFVFHDLFRIAGRRATEHWDVMVPRK